MSGTAEEGLRKVLEERGGHVVGLTIYIDDL